jgi:hypothetical protein
MNYVLGYHPLFQVGIAVKRCFDRPVLAGSLWMMAGFLAAAMRRLPRPVSREFVEFLRSEQMGRLGLGKRDRSVAAEPEG